VVGSQQRGRSTSLTTGCHDTPHYEQDATLACVLGMWADNGGWIQHSDDIVPQVCQPQALANTIQQNVANARPPEIGVVCRTLGSIEAFCKLTSAVRLSRGVFTLIAPIIVRDVFYARIVLSRYSAVL